MEKPYVLISATFKNEVDNVLKFFRNLHGLYSAGIAWSLIFNDYGSLPDELNYLYSKIPKQFAIIQNQNTSYTDSCTRILNYIKSSPTFDYVMFVDAQNSRFTQGTMYHLVKRIVMNDNIFSVSPSLETKPRKGYEIEDNSTNLCKIYSASILRKENYSFNNLYPECEKYIHNDLCARAKLFGYTNLIDNKAIIEYDKEDSNEIYKNKILEILKGNA